MWIIIQQKWDSIKWYDLICMLNNRVTTPVFCCVLPSIVLPSIPSPISWQCHLTPASLSCRQTKWFHNQYERRCNPACFHTLKQTGNNWNRPANQIRNNQCNKYESAYRKMSQRPSRKDVQTGFARRPSWYTSNREANVFLFWARWSRPI